MGKWQLVNWTFAAKNTVLEMRCKIYCIYCREKKKHKSTPRVRQAPREYGLIQSDPVASRPTVQQRLRPPRCNLYPSAQVCRGWIMMRHGGARLKSDTNRDLECQSAERQGIPAVHRWVRGDHCHMFSKRKQASHIGGGRKHPDAGVKTSALLLRVRRVRRVI